jgi:hypothetical protein
MEERSLSRNLISFIIMARLTASPIDEAVDTKLKLEGIIQLMTENREVLINSYIIHFVYALMCVVDTDHTSLSHRNEH